MTIQGVSTPASLMTQSLVDLRGQLDDLQRQIGTGQKSETYAGLGLQRGLVVGLQSQLSAVAGYSDTILGVGTRLQIAQNALQQVDQSAHAVKHSAMNSPFAINQNGQTADQQAAQGQLDQILAALNSRAGDSYIFSGLSPDKAAVETLDHILNGNGGQAGFKQVVSERRQADGASALGRLLIPPAAGTQVSIAEDALNSPFGLKLASVGSNLTGATVTGPSGPPLIPNAITIDLGAGNPNDGDTVKFTFNMPDGTSQDLTLTATASTTPGPNEFTIGANSAITAVNLQAALTAGVTKIADTSLVAASAFAAANDFFNVSATQPPMRVNGPPFSTATSLVAGTSANTVTWYTGEAGNAPARSTAIAAIDPSLTVSYGMRANEQALRSNLQNVAVFAALSFSASNPDAGLQYAAVTQRVSANLDTSQGVQKVSDIEAEIAGAQTSMSAAQDRHKQTSTIITDFLQSIEGVSNDEVAAKLLALQTQLQASLQTTAMLSRLSIVNFIPT